MFGHPLYTEESTPDDIMNSLQKELRSSLDILVLIHVVGPEMKQVLEDTFANYKHQDPYKWYECVKNVLPLP